MESIFNIKIDKDNVLPWIINFKEVTDEVKMKVDKEMNYCRFISNYQYHFKDKDLSLDYNFVIEYFEKNNISYYTLAVVPSKYSLYHQRVNEICEEFNLETIDDLTENICFDYGYCVSLGWISSQKKEFESEIMNELSYVSTVMKDILQFYLNNPDNEYGSTKLDVLKFLCNNENFI